MYQCVGRFNGPLSLIYVDILKSLIGSLIVSSQILICHLQIKHQQQTAILLSREFTPFQEKLQEVRDADPFISKTYVVLLNWHTHYGEVSHRLRDIKDSL